MTRATRMACGALLAVATLVAGCGKLDRGIAKVTGHAEQCIDGVRYLQFTSGATVKYQTDGKIATC